MARSQSDEVGFRMLGVVEHVIFASNKIRTLNHEVNDLIDENREQTDRIFNLEKNLGTAQEQNRKKNREIQVLLSRLRIQSNVPTQHANNNASIHQPNVPEGYGYISIFTIHFPI